MTLDGYEELETSKNIVKTPKEPILFMTIWGFANAVNSNPHEMLDFLCVNLWEALTLERVIGQKQNVYSTDWQARS